MMKQSAVFSENLNAFLPEMEISRALPQFSVSVVDRPEPVAEQWRFLESCARDPFSNYVWVKAWYDAHKNISGCSPTIILGTGKNHKPLFLLPLFRQKSGPFNILVRPGRTHSACSSSLFSQTCRQMINRHNGKDFWKAVFSQVCQADAIAIDGVRDADIKDKNPLRYLPHINTDDPSFELRLTGNWEKFYQSKMTGKARRNVQRCEKRLLERGHLRFKIAESKEERLAYLRILLAQKAEQFTLRGIVNPYTRPGVESFYENLVAEAGNSEDQPLLLSTLALDEKPLAVIFGMIQGSEFHGLIMSMCQGPLARFSPGRILLHRTLQHLSGIGIRKIDFGVGKAGYKQEWVDAEINRHQVLAALNLKGRVLVSGLKQASAIKVQIKRSGWAKELTRRVRWYSMKN